jgi:hypothetical protein
MMNDETVYTKEDLIRAFQEKHDQVYSYFSDLPENTFLLREDGAWAPFDRLEHLLRSLKPLLKAMKTARLTLRVLFGSPKKRSRNFSQIKEEYLQKLKAGARASGQFLPALQNPDEVLKHKNQLLQNWQSVGNTFVQVLCEWKEQDLDKYLLPHPVLGKLTVREMLFFTLYHNHHHTAGAKKSE